MLAGRPRPILPSPTVLALWRLRLLRCLCHAMADTASWAAALRFTLAPATLRPPGSTLPPFAGVICRLGCLRTDIAGRRHAPAHRNPVLYTLACWPCAAPKTPVPPPGPHSHGFPPSLPPSLPDTLPQPHMLRGPVGCCAPCIGVPVTRARPMPTSQPLVVRAMTRRSSRGAWAAASITACEAGRRQVAMPRRWALLVCVSAPRRRRRCRCCPRRTPCCCSPAAAGCTRCGCGWPMDPGRAAA